MKKPKFTPPALGGYIAPQVPDEQVQYGPTPAMARLNLFIRVFVENMINTEGGPDTDNQNLIISRLKTVLGTDALEAEQTASEPGKKQGDEDGGSIIGRMNVFEQNLRKNIRNIINDSF